MKRSIQTSIAEAKALGSPGTQADVTPGLGFVAGRITVSDRLKDRVAPDDTVFIFARPADGSRMPVALLRKHGRDLPTVFALDDSLAMVPTARLSQQPSVIVGVRVSKRGNAIPAPGDLEAETGPVEIGSTGLTLEIDHVRE
jgi:cytochrome c-type biogenesis protein CcmH